MCVNPNQFFGIIDMDHTEVLSETPDEGDRAYRK